MSTFGMIVNILFMIYVTTFAIILFITTISSIYWLHQVIKRNHFHSRVDIESRVNAIPISILVPGYNEEKTIVETVESLLNLDYEFYEIIVINDGSSDGMEKRLIDFYQMEQIHRPIPTIVPCEPMESVYERVSKNIKITLINKKNGGKADALNMGINASRYPYFVSMDADSILQSDSLTKIMMPVHEHEDVIAVGGNIRVSNNIVLKDGDIVDVFRPKNIWVIFQMLEYLRVFLTTRLWFSHFNGTLIVSGAFGLFKKESVINVKGYDLNTIGEDMSLVVKLHAFHREKEIPYEIKYEPFAICWSQVPENFSGLKSQRSRWHVGLMQSLSKHRYMFFNPQYGILGRFVFLYNIVFEMFASIVEQIGFLLVIFFLLVGYLNIKFFLILIAIIGIYGFFITAISILLERFVFHSKANKGIVLRLLFFSLLEPFGYRQIVSYFMTLGIIRFIRKDNKWGKIKRVSHHT